MNDNFDESSIFFFKKSLVNKTLIGYFISPFSDYLFKYKVTGIYFFAINWNNLDDLLENNQDLAETFGYEESFNNIFYGCNYKYMIEVDVAYYFFKCHNLPTCHIYKYKEKFSNFSNLMSFINDLQRKIQKSQFKQIDDGYYIYIYKLDYIKQFKNYESKIKNLKRLLVNKKILVKNNYKKVRNKLVEIDKNESIPKILATMFHLKPNQINIIDEFYNYLIELLANTNKMKKQEPEIFSEHYNFSEMFIRKRTNLDPTVNPSDSFYITFIIKVVKYIFDLIIKNKFHLKLMRQYFSIIFNKCKELEILKDNFFKLNEEEIKFEITNTSKSALYLNYRNITGETEKEYRFFINKLKEQIGNFKPILIHSLSSKYEGFRNGSIVNLDYDFKILDFKKTELDESFENNFLVTLTIDKEETFINDAETQQKRDKLNQLKIHKTEDELLIEKIIEIRNINGDNLKINNKILKTDDNILNKINNEKNIQKEFITIESQTNNSELNFKSNNKNFNKNENHKINDSNEISDNNSLIKKVDFNKNKSSSFSSSLNSFKSNVSNEKNNSESNQSIKPSNFKINCKIKNQLNESLNNNDNQKPLLSTSANNNDNEGEILIKGEEKFKLFLEDRINNTNLLNRNQKDEKNYLDSNRSNIPLNINDSKDNFLSIHNLKNNYDFIKDESSEDSLNFDKLREENKLILNENLQINERYKTLKKFRKKRNIENQNKINTKCVSFATRLIDEVFVESYKEYNKSSYKYEEEKIKTCKFCFISVNKCVIY